jgi:hypothetical protein
MLTLAESYRMGAFTLFRDASYSGGTRTLTSTFYVLPDSPRLARDDDGGPSFRFLWYRRALDVGAAATAGDPVRAGGFLTVTVDLGPTAEERQLLLSDLAAKFQIEGGAVAVNLLPMPYVSGTVALAFAGESGGTADFINRVAGNGPAALTGNEQASFAVDLNQDGAALLARAIDQNLEVLHVRYDLVFEYHLDGVRLRVWCDAKRAQLTAQAEATTAALDPANLRTALVGSQAAGVEIESDTPIPPDQQVALQTLGQTLLDAALAATVIAPGGKNALPFNEAMSAAVNVTFTSTFPAQEHAVADSILQLSVDDTTRSSRIVTIDLANEPQPIDVLIVCPVDFGGGLLTAVHFFIAYDGSGPDGKPIHLDADFVFKAGTSRASFHSLASADQRRYHWHAEVQYRDGTTFTLPEVYDDQKLLILALDGLGVLDVQVVLGDVPVDRVQDVIVDLEYPPRQLTQQMILDKAHATGSWQTAVGEVQPKALRWRATFLCTDNRRISGDWQPAVSTRLIIDAPPEFGPTARIDILSAGDFTDVAQIIVELRLGPDDVSPAQLSFTKAGQTQIWAPELPAGSPVVYQARVTVIRSDGVSRPFDWTGEDSTFLIVRDQTRFRVQVVPRLLDLGGAWSAAAVEFEHEDASANLDERDTVVLRDRTADGAWSFELGASGQHGYRYQLTLVPKAGGKRQVLPWQQAEDEVLVLRPDA